MNVAIFIINIVNLSGSGGAERFNADFFEAYNNQKNPKRKVYFLSDNYAQLYKIGRLKNHTDHQLLFKSYKYRFFHGFTKNRPRIDKQVNKIRDFLTAQSIKRVLKKYNIGAIQVPVYEDKDFELFRKIDNFPSEIRPKLILNLTNAVVYLHYFDESKRYAYHSKLNYGRLFESIRLDGVYTWYKSFKDWALEKKVIKSNPLIHNVSSRFTSTTFHEDFTKRKNKIIFAGRLAEFKDPILFVKAASIFYSSLPTSDWTFEMYGHGPMERELRELIDELKLSEKLTLSFSSDIPHILREAKIYVSTQNVENFPSLAMAEAMASGNLIIARNIGQTDLYVKNNYNGYLMNTDTPEELASLLITAISNENKVEEFAKNSIKLLKEVHNERNFIDEIDEFWDKLNQKK